MKPKDWYALGQIFAGPFWFDRSHGVSEATDGDTALGVQVLIAIEVVSERKLRATPISKTPSAFTADEVIDFLNEVFREYGKPAIGVIISESVWQSSHEFLLDDETLDRGRILDELDIEIGPMQAHGKSLITDKLSKDGLKVQYHGNVVS